MANHPSAHKGSYVRKHRGKPRGPRRTREQIDKDARALDLYCQAKTYQQIADIIGWKSHATAVMAVQRAISDRRVGELDQVDNFAVALESVNRAIAYHEQVMATKHYVTSTTGKLVLGPDGSPLLDPAPGQRSAAELRHLYDQRNRLLGNYAPAKVRQEIVPEDVVDQEIARLAKKLSEAGRNTGVPAE